MADIENPKELTSIQRTLFMASRLFRGRAFTTSELADAIGLSYSGAYYLMTIASQSEFVAIYQDDAGYWRVLEDSV